MTQTAPTLSELQARNAELEAAIEEIRDAWAYFHSVNGACSRQMWIYAITQTQKAVEKVWRPGEHMPGWKEEAPEAQPPGPII